MENIIQFESANVKITPFSIEFENGTSFEEWQSVYEKLEKFDGIMQLYIGDCLNFGQYAYGEKYTEFMKHSKYDYSTLAHFCSVARRFDPPTRESFGASAKNVTFSQLREVAPLEDTKALQLVTLADECGWNRDRLREEVNKIRHPEYTVLIPEDVADSILEAEAQRQEKDGDVSEIPVDDPLIYLGFTYYDWNYISAVLSQNNGDTGIIERINKMLTETTK